MKLSEINNMLDTTGYPVAYLAFPKNKCPTMPYIIWQEYGTNNISADNIVWVSFRKIQIDLLTAQRDEAVEENVQKTLNKAGIYWTKETGYDDTEKYTRITYECEV